MKVENLKKAYTKIATKPEFDEKMMQEIKSYETIDSKIRKSYFKYVAIATVAILLVGVYQIPVVSVYANQTWKSFINIFSIGNEQVEMVGAYMEINENAPKEETKYDGMKKIQQDLGIKILTSSLAHSSKKSVFTYNPYTDKNAVVYGAIIKNDCYIVGDLKEVEFASYGDGKSNNTISYKDGEEYHSPISMQITIRTDKELSVDYQNHELEYGGKIQDAADDNTVLYKSKNLGINILLSTVNTDGIITWNDNDISSMTVAQFVYDGVEYQYYGDVSYSTMERIIESLAY